MFDYYQFELTLIRDQLATNPCDPNILDQHILQKERDMILKESPIDKIINKYKDAVQITPERCDAELDRLCDALEHLTGVCLTDEDRVKARAGKLDELKTTFKEIIQKGTTVFLFDKEIGRPCLGDHMVYGFMKAAAEAVAGTLPMKKKTVLNSCAYTQKLINTHIRCCQQFIVFDQDISRDSDGQPNYCQRSLRVQTGKGPRVALTKSQKVDAGAKLNFTLKVLKDSPMKESHLRVLFNMGELFGLGQWRNAGYGMFTYEMKKVEI